ncbi:MAG: O-acetyl-ADP-ribose deacetylase [Sphaerochaetaceae bacterium]|nr:O-acetyl-ADP-ribose deacetylase [Sphaerochaetaceae bacterium]
MDKRIHIVRDSVVWQDTDAIVNAANSSLLGGGGVDGAIHAAAGPLLVKECATLGGCKTGEAKITKGYKLKAKYVIHTVGPVYSGTDRDRTLLSSCYTNCLNLALENGCKSISFCCISTGVYRYPLKEATEIALSTTENWLEDHPETDFEVRFCCYSDREYFVYKNYCS